MTCLHDVSRIFKDVIKTPAGTPKEFRVASAGFPSEIFSPRRNIFSTLFHAAYILLDIPLERRLVYGKINYLFRVWVTAADNLLDHEDKMTVKIIMPSDSRVMRQVVSIMAADRVLSHIIRDAFCKGGVTPDEGCALMDGTLEVLLPSAAEEAAEEKGIVRRPKPEYVLKTIHRLKTQLLFQIPLVGPERVEKNIDLRKLALYKEGLGKFGLGCQILDDIRDIGRDHVHKRHNYILSVMAHQDKSALKMLEKVVSTRDVDMPVFLNFQAVTAPAARLAEQELVEGIHLLDMCGLGIDPKTARAVVRYMFKALDVEKAIPYLDKS
jgi:hypothetical protein